MMDVEKTAEYLQDLPGFQGVARLYRLSEPLQDDSQDEEVVPPAYTYVVVSAVVVPITGPETYVFGSDEYGNVEAWGELPGSFRGDLNHEEALARAGYTVQTKAQI